MSEEKVLENQEEEVVEKEEVGESEQPQLEGDIVQFTVGINSNQMYNVRSTVETGLDLREYMQAIATIKLNTIISILSGNEKKYDNLKIFKEFEKETLSMAIDKILEGFSEKEIPDIEKKQIKKLFAE